MKFKQTKNKFNKIFELNKSTDGELEEKKNEEPDIKLDDSNIKNAKLLLDTGWKSVLLGGFTPVPVPGELLNRQLGTGADVNVNIEEHMLGSIEHAFLFRNKNLDSEAKVVPFFQGQRSTYLSNQVRVYGDNSLIFFGAPPNFGAVLNVHSSVDLLNEHSIPLSHTKKAWLGTIIENDDTVHFGYIKTIDTNLNTVEDTCESNDDKENFLMFHFESNGQSAGTHELLSINSNGFTAIGVTRIDNWADIQDPGPPDVPQCSLTQTVIPDDNRSLSFDDLDSYSIAMTQQPNAGNGFQNSVTITGSNIKSISFEEVGVHVYYDSSRSFRITSDGTNIFHLTPLPTNLGPDADVSYSTIKLTRNENQVDDLSIQTVEQLADNRSNEPGIAKLSKSDEIQTRFKIWFFSNFNALAPANIKEDMVFPLLTDEYTSTNFSVVNHDHDQTFNAPAYNAQIQIESRLLVYVTNPFYYKEKKIHDIE